MVTICAKTYCKPTIQDVMLAKIRKKKEDENIEEFFKKLKHQREERNSKVLSGTIVPNSTFRSFLAGRTENNDSELSVGESDKAKSSSSITTKQSRGSSIKSINKNNIKGREDSSAIIVIKSDDSQSSSIISGTRTLEELKELRDLLHKSSYVPKKTKTRRPTIEKIRSAIEREKQTLNRNKNETTVIPSVEVSDASTITEKKKKKKRTTGTKKSLNSVSKGSSTSRSADTGSSVVHVGKKGKKTNRKKKTDNQINIEIQRSIFKITTNE